MVLGGDRKDRSSRNNVGGLRPPPVFPSYYNKRIWGKKRTAKRGRPPAVETISPKSLPQFPPNNQDPPKKSKKEADG